MDEDSRNKRLVAAILYTEVSHEEAFSIRAM